jgi:hypothetical protein
MSMPSYPDQDNESVSQAAGGRTKLIIAVVVVLVSGVIALHVAGVFVH